MVDTVFLFVLPVQLGWVGWLVRDGWMDLVVWMDPLTISASWSRWIPASFFFGTVLRAGGI